MTSLLRNHYVIAIVSLNNTDIVDVYTLHGEVKPRLLLTFRPWPLLSNKHSLYLSWHLTRSLVKVGARRTDEQFQRMSLNSCWHDATACLAAWATAGISSTLCLQNATSSFLNPTWLFLAAVQSRVLFHEACFSLAIDLEKERHLLLCILPYGDHY